MVNARRINLNRVMVNACTLPHMASVSLGLSVLRRRGPFRIHPPGTLRIYNVGTLGIFEAGTLSNSSAGDPADFSGRGPFRIHPPGTLGIHPGSGVRKCWLRSSRGV